MIGAVLLAGGAGSRLRGVDKASLRLDGAALLDRAVAALDGLPLVVVGPQRDGVRTVQEHPPFGGPAAGAATGMAALPGCDEVLLLAVDVPRLPEVLPLLLAAAPGPDGVVAVDADDREQWLLGRYRTAALAGRLDERWTDRPLRALLAGLTLARLPLPPGVGADVDTVADARAAGVRLPQEGDR